MDIPANQLSDLDQKLLIGLGTGILGFVSAYVLDVIKKRREPRKELSYEIHIPDPLIDVSPKVAEKVKVTYGQSDDIKNLYFVVFKIENTGNRLVKGQQLRFSFNKESQLLEDVFEPEPPQEYGVRRVDHEDGKSERRYAIDHFERASKFEIRFVLSSENPPQVEVFPKNEEGDLH